MRRAVIGFYQDDEMHWVAKLACGHGQHVRHDPPWTVREWTTTEEGRAQRIGSLMECKKCDEESSQGEIFAEPALADSRIPDSLRKRYFLAL